LDSEWLLSILFDASRFPTQKAALGRLFFICAIYFDVLLTLSKGKLPLED
jgi:hypothetical protein